MTVRSGIRSGFTLVVAIVALMLAGGVPEASPLSADRAAAQVPIARAGGAHHSHAPPRLIARSTGRHPELRKTIPITRRAHSAKRVVMSLPLPRLRRHDLIRINGEIATSTTCVTASLRCIGRIYRFDPRISAQVVLAARAKSTTARATRTVSPRTALSCGQSRPNRNHHCPLAIENGGFQVRKLSRLPCAPRHCMLNLVLAAHHRQARGGEVLVVGGDRPDGSVDQDKGRLSAAIIRANEHQLDVHDYSSHLRRRSSLEADFLGGERVIYSRMLSNLHRGDVLIARARQRTAIPGGAPYFVSNQIIVSSDPDGSRPTPLSKRAISGGGTVTQSNGFNCTRGPSAFRTPCTSRKSGIVRIRRTPRRPLFVNLVSRTFPLIAQGSQRSQRSQGGSSSVRILRGGGIAVQRLRVPQRRRHGPRAGKGGANPGAGLNPLLPLPPLPIIGPGS